MKTFLKMLLASLIGGGILLFVLFIIFASLISLSGKPEMKVQPNTILKIPMDTRIVERAQENPFEEFSPFPGQFESALGLNKLLGALQAAQDDDNIIGVYLDGGMPSASAASLRELRNALIDFRKSGKFIYGYSEVISQKGLYLSSVADTMWVNPEGFAEWRGLSASVTYYKEALEKIGLEPVVLRATGNEYKSAVEPFLSQDMTDQNREQLTQLLSSNWNTYRQEIAASRNLKAEDLDQMADSLAITSPREAQESGMITGLAYQDQMDSLLMARSRAPDLKQIPFLSTSKYAKGLDVLGQKEYAEDEIALVIAEGGIQSGEGSSTNIGSERFRRAIRKARKDPDVKAVVLRINSPGGSALASEVIWREIMLTRKEKPVIASMGGVAASGGYYLACYADTILAQPNTVTGSIGAFGLFFTAEELLHDKLGVNIETVTTNAYADLPQIDEPISPAEKRRLIHQVDRTYQTFIQRVAEGRNLSVDYVDSIGSGRIYSGVDAQKLGLVDLLGGLPAALDIAADKAGLEGKYRVTEFPEAKDPLEQFLENISGQYQASLVRESLGPLKSIYDTYEEAKGMQGYQMRIPYKLSID